ncbi:MAG: symmetrical bis(5'-nucleosyl)-tetraphosphatase [Methylovulum sp.]|nr:symmetrical bis(5'-nucleosyl)-tetraphosphatase [Methylovulum sp.]
MTTYAIGNVKGHYQPLLQLLAKIRFDPEQDSLWFTGNLIDEGPEPLAVLRFVKSLGKQAITVLGHRELHLLMLAQADGAEVDEVLAEVLNAPDREELLKWLRRRPLIHHDAQLNFTLVHAGIPAEWSFSQALTFAYEVESALSQGSYAALFENGGQDQSRWHAKLRGWKRLRFIANAYTLMKYCNGQGKLDFKFRGATGTQAEGFMPWYRRPERLTANLNIIFADDAEFNDVAYHGIYPLPTQGQLSALSLSATPEMFSVAYG